MPYIKILADNLKNFSQEESVIILETIEKLMYRGPMVVKEIVVWQNGYAFPICPRCDCTIEREYQSFCDRCGQMLKWEGFSRAKVRRT